MHVAHVDDGRGRAAVEGRALQPAPRCDGCGRSFEALNPHHFSFNSPLGWCPTCEGLGVQQGANPAALIRDGRRSLRAGRGRRLARLRRQPDVRPDDRGDGRAPAASTSTRRSTSWTAGTAGRSCTARATPGSPSRPADGQPEFSFQYKGLFPAIDEAARVTFVYRHKLEGMVDEVPCAACMGARLRDDAAAVRFRGVHARPDRRLAARRHARRSSRRSKLSKATSGRSPANCSARSATACSSWSTSASTT